MRLALVFSAWALIVGAGPGVVFAGAVGGAPTLVGVAGLASWAWLASKPGRFAFGIEWLAASVGLGLTMWWIYFVFPPTIIPAALGMGLYMALAGVLLRRLLHCGIPLWLAAALSWTSLETLRDLIHPPFGMGWLRVGHLAVFGETLASTASVWGVAGLTFVLVATAATLSQMAQMRSARRAALGFAPLAVAIALSLIDPTPKTSPGPRVLIVQPGLTQEEKQNGLSGPQRFQKKLDAMTAVIDATAVKPDLVMWPESALGIELGVATLGEAIRAGAELAPWWSELPPERRLEPEHLLHTDALERRLIDGEIMRRLPVGTAFLVGAEQWTHRVEGERTMLRRRNVSALWQRGRERQIGVKRKLAPGGETLWGVESFGPVRRYTFGVANYLPDFIPGDVTNTAEFSGLDGRVWRASQTVCFDNAFLFPYTDAAVAGADLHTVVSNEAWYKRSIELDQMVVFSQAIAAATRLPVVRATNSGISCVISPDGRIAARLTTGGDDREVAGTLLANVPVIKGGSPTLFARAARAIRLAFAGAGPLLALTLLLRRRASAQLEPTADEPPRSSGDRRPPRG